MQEYKTLITALNTNCTVEALSKDRSLDEGFRAIYNSIDEIHQHKDNSIYKALYNGTRALNETLNSMTTTRGRDLNSFCYEMDSYCLNILNGTVTAEDFFVDIYTLDDGDDPFDEANWIKANPLLARTEGGMETLRTEAQTAKDMGGMELADYLTKCMNMWVQKTDNQYIDVEAFRNCGSDRKLDYLLGANAMPTRPVLWRLDHSVEIRLLRTVDKNIICGHIHSCRGQGYRAHKNRPCPDIWGRKG